MKVFTYRATDPDTPEHLRFAAVMEPGPHAHWTATGSTAEEAAAKLHAFWEKERAHYAPRVRKPKPQVVEDVL